MDTWSLGVSAGPSIIPSPRRLSAFRDFVPFFFNLDDGHHRRCYYCRTTTLSCDPPLFISPSLAGFQSSSLALTRSERLFLNCRLSLERSRARDGEMQ